MRKVISVATIIAVGVIAATGLLLPAAVEEGPSYRISGDYFETCSCNPACPCVFKSDATNGFCKSSVIYHVAEGSVGEVDVAGALGAKSQRLITHRTGRLGAEVNRRRSDRQLRRSVTNNMQCIRTN